MRLLAPTAPHLAEGALGPARSPAVRGRRRLAGRRRPAAAAGRRARAGGGGVSQPQGPIFDRVHAVLQGEAAYGAFRAGALAAAGFADLLEARRDALEAGGVPPEDVDYAKRYPADRRRFIDASLASLAARGVIPHADWDSAALTAADRRQARFVHAGRTTYIYPEESPARRVDGYPPPGQGHLPGRLLRLLGGRGGAGDRRRWRPDGVGGSRPGLLRPGQAQLRRGDRRRRGRGGRLQGRDLSRGAGRAMGLGGDRRGASARSSGPGAARQGRLRLVAGGGLSLHGCRRPAGLPQHPAGGRHRRAALRGDPRTQPARARAVPRLALDWFPDWTELPTTEGVGVGRFRRGAR